MNRRFKFKRPLENARRLEDGIVAELRTSRPIVILDDRAVVGSPLTCEVLNFLVQTGNEFLSAVDGTEPRVVPEGAAQLIKHYLGLANACPTGPVTLLYLFWEPENWADLPSCVEHRGEVAAFAGAVSGDRVAFEWATCRDLWTHWERVSSSRDWLVAHVAALRARYDVRVGDQRGG